MLAATGGVLAILLLTADYTPLGMTPRFGILQLTAVITLCVVVLYHNRWIWRLERIKEKFESLRVDLIEKNTLLTYPRLQRNTLVLVGVILTILCLTADYTGLGLSPGIGNQQIIGPICGVALVGAGLFLNRRLSEKRSEWIKWLYALGVCLLALVLLLTSKTRPDIFPLRAMGTLILALFWTVWLLMFSRGINEFHEEVDDEERGRKRLEKKSATLRCFRCGSPVLKQVVICPECGSYRSISKPASRRDRVGVPPRKRVRTGTPSARRGR